MSKPPTLTDAASWLVNAGQDDTKRGLAAMTGTPRDIADLQAALAHEEASASPRSSRIKPIRAKLARFVKDAPPVPAFDPDAIIEAELDADALEATEVLAPESLLDGTTTTALSPVQASALAAVDTAWADASRLAGLAKNYARASTAAKALCGIRLRALREHYFGPRNPNGGRPKKTPNVSAFSTWEEMLADRVGITRDTGENWMKMAEAVEHLADRENIDLQSICEKLPWDWTPEETARLDAAVHKLTEDKTQRQLLQSDFLSDLGYQAPEKPNSSNNPLGKNGGKKKPAASPQQLIAERQEAARLLIFGTVNPGKVDRGSPAMFMETVIGTAGSQIEALPQAELRDLYENTVKPFAAVIRKLAGL